MPPELQKKRTLSGVASHGSKPPSFVKMSAEKKGVSEGTCAFSEPTNGHSDVAMADISVAEEADEGKGTEGAAAGGPGFLKKTISRIWGSGSTNGAGYQEVNETTAAGMVAITKKTKA